MFETMVDEELMVASSPDLIAEIRTEEREIGRRRARQVRLLRELLRRSVTGTRYTASAIARQLDVSTDTARALLETADRTPEDSDRMAKLEDGEWSFDRTAAMARLFAAGADDQTMAAGDERDIAGIHKLRALTRRIRRRDERQAQEERHVRSWPSLDESVGFMQVQLGSYEWQTVNRALDERADQFPREARSFTREQRRADALVAIAQDWLLGPTGSPGSQVRWSWSTRRQPLKPIAKPG